MIHRQESSNLNHFVFLSIHQSPVSVSSVSLQCQSPVTDVVTEDLAGVVVDFSAAAVEGGDPAQASGLLDVVSIPASGSLFAPGETLVSHFATDIAGNSTVDYHTATVILGLSPFDLK